MRGIHPSHTCCRCPPGRSFQTVSDTDSGWAVVGETLAALRCRSNGCGLNPAIRRTTRLETESV
jgi:hypothetical protein